MATTVCNVRGIVGEARAALLADPMFQYVGRGCGGWRCSAWGNPFKVGMRPADVDEFLFHMRRKEALVGPLAYSGTERLTAAEAVELYRRYVLACPGLAKAVPGLSGKRLGCWCCEWSPGDPVMTPCHGIVLAEIAEM
jgi:hypothetical protein